MKQNKVMRKIAGIKVTNGKIIKKCKYRLIRFDKEIKDDLELIALKHFKEDVSELVKGSEGGLSFISYNELQKGDILEAYEEQEYVKLFQADI